MSELLSTQIMERLRHDASRRMRAKERMGTLSRLEEACNDIASGRARQIVKQGFPEAEIHYQRNLTPIRPPRVEEYVRARRAIDAKARRIQSHWTGPYAVTLRKDKDLLEYVRVREQEQGIHQDPSVSMHIELALDRVDDMALRSELRYILARARQAEHDLKRLKEGMRNLRPTLDIDVLISQGAKAHLANALPAENHTREKTNELARLAIQRLTDPSVLVKCGLQFNQDVGNVVERRTRFEFLTAHQLEALGSLLSNTTAPRS